jgi:hypothetical protein
MWLLLTAARALRQGWKTRRHQIVKYHRTSLRAPLFQRQQPLAISIEVCSCISGLLRTAFASKIRSPDPHRLGRLYFGPSLPTRLLRPGPRSYTQAPRLVLSAWALMVPTIQILILLLIIVASVAVVAARVKVHQPEHQARLAPELGKVRLGDSH